MPARKKRRAPARARSRPPALKAPACPEGRRFQDFVEGASDIFWETDAEGRYSYVSPGARAVYGLPAAKMLGRSFLDFVPEDEARRVGAVLAELARGKAPFELVLHRVRRAGGGERWVECSGKPLVDAKGRLTGWRGIDRDVTERVRSEGDFRSLNLFLDSVVEHLPLMVFVKDAADLRFVRFNKAGERLLGVPRSEMIGKSDYDFFPRAQADFFTRKDREVLAGGGVVEIPEEPIRTKGGERWLRTWKIPVLGPDGRPRYLLGISEDITEARRTGRELRSKEEQLRLAQRLESVGRLAGGVAHEFNNALTSISGLAQLIRESLGSGRPEAADAEDILAACRKAAGVVTHLLTFSRRRAASCSRLDLGPVLARAAAVVRPSVPTDVELKVTAPSAAWVMGDAPQLEQAVVNLLLNAVDAVRGEGRVALSAELVASDVPIETPFGPVPPGRWTRVLVSDDGAGIPAEHHARVFEPFFTTKPVGQGSGLGLAVVYGIISQHGGHVRLRSEPGKGTVVELYLPVCGEEPGASAAARAPGRSHASTVLVAEDDPVVRRLVERILKRAGHDVLTAADGEAAVELFSRHKDRIGMLLLDVAMPRRQGYEVYETLAPQKAGIKVLFMSGLTETGSDDPVARLGLPLLLKPFSQEALAQRVQEILDA